MEVVCLVMEVFYQYDNKIKVYVFLFYVNVSFSYLIWYNFFICFVWCVFFQYDIVGYLGDFFEIFFVFYDLLFKNNKECFNIIKKMYVYVQYCWSGDYILEGIDLVVKYIIVEEVDDYFVVVFSDVNFEWYGIFVEVFGKVFMLDV